MIAETESSLQKEISRILMNHVKIRLIFSFNGKDI